MRTTPLLATLLLALLFQPQAGWTDVLYLKNGDRLTGSIINMEDQKVTFWSKYAGEITLFWQDVDHFILDDTAKVVLKKPTAPKTTALPEEDKGQKVEPASPPPPTPDMIFAINPKPIIPVKIVTRVNGKLTGERGNTDKDVYYINGEFIARTERRRYAFDGEYQQEKKNNILTEDNWLTHAKINQFIDVERYIYADTLFENNTFKDLELRSTYGLGAGYQFVENEQVNLSISMGAAWVTEDFYEAEVKEFMAGQWAIDFDRFLYRDRIQFFHTEKGYVSLENSEDWLIRTKTGFRFPFYRGFTATIQYDYDWDNEPASDAETEEDAAVLFLLGYEFNN